ncbi:MAG: hypothetical protein HY094_04275 [Candidatus Melainabacteria bacterium]|nr:hypothetical protein [Candidatus Melainabacteria bacterium]
MVLKNVLKLSKKPLYIGVLNSKPASFSDGGKYFQIEDAEEFCTDVVEKKGVLLTPSNYYDYGNRNCRVSFCRKNMLEAIKRFEDYLLER